MYHLYVYNKVCDSFFLFLKGIMISDRKQTTAYDCVFCFSYFVHVGSLYFSRTRYSRLLEETTIVFQIVGIRNISILSK